MIGCLVASVAGGPKLDIIKAARRRWSGLARTPNLMQMEIAIHKARHVRLKCRVLSNCSVSCLFISDWKSLPRALGRLRIAGQ